MRPRLLLLMAVMFAVLAGSVFEAAQARRKEAKVMARIHYSSNFDGELEPCG